MKRLHVLLAGLLLLGMDQLSKMWVIKTLTWHQSTPVCSVFSLTLVANSGISFGLLDFAGPYMLIALTSLLTIGFCVAFWRNQEPLYWWIYGLVICGAVGNLWDRIQYGFVIDFLDFHWGPHHWNIFNVADVLITLGGVLVMIDALRKYGNMRTRRERKV